MKNCDTPKNALGMRDTYIYSTTIKECNRGSEFLHFLFFHTAREKHHSWQYALCRKGAIAERFSKLSAMLVCPGCADSRRLAAEAVQISEALALRCETLANEAAAARGVAARAETSAATFEKALESARNAGMRTAASERSRASAALDLVRCELSSLREDAIALRASTAAALRSGTAAARSSLVAAQKAAISEVGEVRGEARAVTTAAVRALSAARSTVAAAKARTAAELRATAEAWALAAADIRERTRVMAAEVSVARAAAAREASLRQSADTELQKALSLVAAAEARAAAAEARIAIAEAERDRMEVLCTQALEAWVAEPQNGRLSPVPAVRSHSHVATPEKAAASVQGPRSGDHQQNLQLRLRASAPLTPKAVVSAAESHPSDLWGLSPVPAPQLPSEDSAAAGMNTSVGYSEELPVAWLSPGPSQLSPPRPPASHALSGVRRATPHVLSPTRLAVAVSAARAATSQRPVSVALQPPPTPTLFLSP